MQLKQGLWLTLVDEAGEATPVACDVASRSDGHWVLEALVPPQVYPVTFLKAQLRLDGCHLGQIQFSTPITTVTHEPLDVRLDFPVDEKLVEACAQKR
jgi:hypothetical protein